MTIEEKFVNLLYKLTKTCHPRTPDSFYLGGTRIVDMPNQIDEFMRLWLIEYDKKMRRFWIFRPWFERLFATERFVNFEEYQQIFDGGVTKSVTNSTEEKRTSKLIDDMMICYPVYRLANVKNERGRQQFIINYKNDQKGYFAFMKKKNPKLWTLFHDWHQVSVLDKNKIHTWITGTTGIGKSELMKQMVLHDIKSKLSKDCSIIVIDPNGDFVKEIAQFREIAQAENKKKLMYIDMDLFHGEFTPVINPYDIPEDAKDERTIDLQKQQITKVLEDIFKWVGQPLTYQQQAIFGNINQLLLETGNGSFWDVQKIVTPGKSHLANHVAQPYIELGKKSENPSTRHFFSRVYDSNPEYQVSKSGIYTKIEGMVGMNSFANLISGKSTIDLKEAFDANRLVLFNLAIGNLGDKAPIFIGKILVALIQSIIFRRSSLQKDERKPVYLYIDEFQDFVSPSLIRIMTQGRKYKIYLTLANQFVGQGMTREELDAILGTTKIKIMGHNAKKSLKELSVETDAEIEYLQKLDVGEFMIKIGNADPFILHPSKKTLDNKNAMTDREWKDIVNNQKQKFYRYKPAKDILDEMKRQEANPDSILNRKPTDEKVKRATKKQISKDQEKAIKPPFKPYGEDEHNDKENSNREI
jgi:hypothetical protein